MPDETPKYTIADDLDSDGDMRADAPIYIAGVVRGPHKLTRFPSSRAR
jgi:hypothetical protein